MAKVRIGFLELDQALLKFAVVGGSAFFIDLGLLKLFTEVFHWPEPWARYAVSFPSALIFTFLLNRAWTFKDRQTGNIIQEFGRYVSVQLLGSAANLISYAALLKLSPFFSAHDAVALAIGAVAGATFNYLGAKHVAFTGRTPDKSVVGSDPLAADPAKR